MLAKKCLAIGDDEAKIKYLLNSYMAAFHSAASYYSGVTVMHNGEPYDVGLYHISGQEDFDRLRTLSYPGTDVSLVCFSVVSPSTYKNVKDKWVPELKLHCPNIPFLLVGTHIDLRDDSTVLEQLAKSEQSPLSPEHGEKLAQELGAVKYMECSATTQEGLKEVFDEAFLVAVKPPDSKPKKCCVLL